MLYELHTYYLMSQTLKLRRLTQVVHEAGFETIFYPKYICALNYIEMVWGWAKSHHRQGGGGLLNTFDNLLQVGAIRKFLQHCLRYMSGYRQNLESPLLDYAMRKYTGHRVVPLGVVEELSK
jgi:hypothetical protein